MQRVVKPGEPTGYFIKKDFPSILSYTSQVSKTTPPITLTDYEYTTETFVFKAFKTWGPVYTRLIIHQPGYHTVFTWYGKLYYRTMTRKEFDAIKGQEKDVVNEIVEELKKRGVSKPQ